MTVILNYLEPHRDNLLAQMMSVLLKTTVPVDFVVYVNGRWGTDLGAPISKLLESYHATCSMKSFNYGAHRDRFKPGHPGPNVEAFQLFLPAEMLANGITRAVFLGRSTMVTGDLAVLETIELSQQYPVAMAPGRGGFSPGLLLLDFSLLPADLENRVAAITAGNQEIMYDGVVNEVFAGMTKVLPVTYNLNSVSLGWNQWGAPIVRAPWDGQYLERLLGKSYMDTVLAVTSDTVPSNLYERDEYLDAFTQLPEPGEDKSFLLLDRQELERRLAEHRSVPIQDLQPLSNRQHRLEDPEIRASLDAQISGIRTPDSDWIAWLVVGMPADLQVFLDYYGPRLPRNTFVVVAMDNYFPAKEETKRRIKEVFPNSVFIENPDDSPVVHVVFQRYVFETLLTRIGVGKWNLFVDLDEIIPLPYGVPDFQAFTKILDSKGIAQLRAFMWDTYLLNHEGDVDTYVQARPYSLSFFWGTEEGWSWDENASYNDFFLLPNGKVWIPDNLFRGELFGYRGATQKVVLVRGTPDLKYTLSSHEQYRNFNNLEEAMVRYPLIHLKYTERYLQNIEDSVYRIDKISAMMDQRRAIEMRFTPDFLHSELNRLRNGGLGGRYGVLNPEDKQNTLIFKEFGDYLTKLSNIFDSNYNFDPQNLALQRVFPLVSIGDLFNTLKPLNEEDRVSLAERLVKHQSLSLAQRQPWTENGNSRHSGYPTDALDAWVDSARDALAKPAPLTLYLICGSSAYLTLFLSYYESRLPRDTRVILMLDFGIPDEQDIRNRFLAAFPNTLFAVHPEGLPFSFYRSYLVERIFEIVGIGAWNLFLDPDEILPLPQGFNDFQQFIDHLSAKGVGQLRCYLWDVFELRKGNLPGLWLQTKEFLLQFNPFPREKIVSRFSDIRDLYITETGTAEVIDGTFRRQLLDFDEIAQKVPLVFGTADMRPTFFAHEFPGVMNKADSLIRYPLLHFKWTAPIVTELRSRVIRPDISPTLGVRVNGIEFLQNLLNTIETTGLGRYGLLNENQSQRQFFEDFPGIMSPLQSIFDSEYRFDPENPILKAFLYLGFGDLFKS